MSCPISESQHHDPHLETRSYKSGWPSSCFSNHHLLPETQLSNCLLLRQCRIFGGNHFNSSFILERYICKYFSVRFRSHIIKNYIYLSFFYKLSSPIIRKLIPSFTIYIVKFLLNGWFNCSLQYWLSQECHLYYVRHSYMSVDIFLFSLFLCLCIHCYTNTTLC